MKCVCKASIYHQPKSQHSTMLSDCTMQKCPVERPQIAIAGFTPSNVSFQSKMVGTNSMQLAEGANGFGSRISVSISNSQWSVEILG